MAPYIKPLIIAAGSMDREAEIIEKFAYYKKTGDPKIACLYKIIKYGEKLLWLKHTQKEQ
jgi:hypothetical protein